MSPSIALIFQKILRKLFKLRPSRSNLTVISSQMRTKLRDRAIWQARVGCYSQAALSSNDPKTLYMIRYPPSLWVDYLIRESLLTTWALSLLSWLITCLTTWHLKYYLIRYSIASLGGFHLVRTQIFWDFRPPPSPLYAFHTTYQYCRTQKLVISLTPPSPSACTY